MILYPGPIFGMNSGGVRGVILVVGILSVGGKQRRRVEGKKGFLPQLPDNFSKGYNVILHRMLTSLFSVVSRIDSFTVHQPHHPGLPPENR